MNRKLKGFLSVAISVVLMFQMLMIVSSAEDAIKIQAADVYYTEQEQLAVPIHIEKNSGFAGFRIIINYDTDVFTPTSVKKGDALSDTSGYFNDSIGGNIVDRLEVVWTSSENVTSDGTLFIVFFDVQESFMGSSTININFNQEDTFNENYNDVVFSCEGVVVSSKDNVSLQKAEIFVPSESIVQIANDINIPVYIKKNPGIMGFKLYIEYDSDIILPVSVEKSDLMGEGMFEYNIKSEEKKIIIIWNSDENIVENGLLFTLKCDVLKTSKETKLNISYNQDDTFDENWNDVELVCAQGLFATDYVDPSLLCGSLHGTVKSFLSETDAVNISLVSKEEPEQMFALDVKGNNAEYVFENVESGDYTIVVFKNNHVTRNYEITIGMENVVQDMKINPVGDVNGDGRVNTIDVARANAHAKSATRLEGYELACVDINGDGKVNTIDVARMNAHAKSVSSLW